ncbi:MAG: glycoside hydrolase family 20, partial [Verrucomicrobia bacterium]
AGLAAYDWYYHPFGRHPRMELRTFAEYDLAPALRAAGIAYWACPMNGAFRHEAAPMWTDRLQNLAAWWARAHRTAAAGYLVTSWEPYRLALPTPTLMDAAAAALWSQPDSLTDPASLLAAGLRRHCPRLAAPSARSLARRLLATDALAFVGNSRWEINLGWASVAGRRDTALPHARAARQLNRLAADALFTRISDLGALRATVQFQAYLAQREVFVRTAAALTFRLRRAMPESAKSAAIGRELTEMCLVFADQLRAGRLAARAMWTASRPAATFTLSQNAARLAADAERLRALREWLRRAIRQPAGALAPSPVCGRWTLRFTVHHFAPCHQKLVVEQQQPDSSWRELYARVLIEFRGDTARPSTPRLRFELAVPITDADAPLRIGSRCLGEFAVSHIELTDGVATRQQTPLRKRHLLGLPAPATGWPRIDWLTNTGTLNLCFDHSRLNG